MEKVGVEEPAEVMDLEKHKEDEEVSGETKPLVNEMLIAVSINKPELSSEVSEGFGRSRFFLIYDSDKKVSEIIENPFVFELGAAGIQTARFLIEKNVEALITAFVGLTTLRLFNSMNIKIFQGNNLAADKALELFAENKLTELTDSDVRNLPGRRRYGRRNFHHGSK
jgi:predicted Fe-Mo cluster-binding NifX family protein